MKKKKLKKIIRELEFRIGDNLRTLAALEIEVERLSSGRKLADTNIAKLWNECHTLRLKTVNPPHAEYLRAYDDDIVREEEE